MNSVAQGPTAHLETPMTIDGRSYCDLDVAAPLLDPCLRTIGPAGKNIDRHYSASKTGAPPFLGGLAIST